MFRSIPDDWPGRWRLIRRFAAKVYSVKLPDIGRVPSLAQEIEAQLHGQRLPPSIVEWIGFIEDLSSACPRAAFDLTYGGNQPQNHPEYAAIRLKMWERMWAVAYDETDAEDPLVGTWGWVEHRQRFVYRKSLPRAPVTEFALHAFIGDVGQRWSLMGSELADADTFVDSVKAAGVTVSEPFGSLRFIEGRGWFSYVQKGYDLFHGRQERLWLKWHGRRSLEDFPKVLRDQVCMKRVHLEAN